MVNTAYDCQCVKNLAYNKDCTVLYNIIASEKTNDTLTMLT